MFDLDKFDMVGDEPRDDGQYLPMCARCMAEGVELFPALCAEKPERLIGAPLGQYHCPDCGAMVCAGVPHGSVCALCRDKIHPDFDKKRKLT